MCEAKRCIAFCGTLSLACSTSNSVRQSSGRKLATISSCVRMSWHNPEV